MCTSMRIRYLKDVGRRFERYRKIASMSELKELENLSFLTVQGAHDVSSFSKIEYRLRAVIRNSFSIHSKCS